VRSPTDPRFVPPKPRSGGGGPAAVVILAVFLSAGAAAQQTTGATDHPRLADIERAIAHVKADPNLATEHTIKTLKWRASPDSKPFSMPLWLQWVAGLFRWLEQSARALVWCAAAVLAGLLGAYIYRVVRARNTAGGADAFVAPTHVRDLDIRPETLPADIGAAARALWDRGEARAALALLYRGMLSRLAHVHRVPIRDSSTEGDCLALAANHLSQDRHEYTLRLVRVWQRSVYGRERVAPTMVYALCDDFATALDARVALDPLPDGSAA